MTADYLDAGKSLKTIELAPYALDWFNRECQVADYWGGTEIYSDSGTHFVHMGKIRFNYAFGLCNEGSKGRKVCLIPHVYKRSKNVMYIIERGPRWREA